MMMFIRDNRLSKKVLEPYGGILDPCRHAWTGLVAEPWWHPKLLALSTPTLSCQ